MIPIINTNSNTNEDKDFSKEYRDTLFHKVNPTAEKQRFNNRNGSKFNDELEKLIYGNKEQDSNTQQDEDINDSNLIQRLKQYQDIIKKYNK